MDCVGVSRVQAEKNTWIRIIFELVTQTFIQMNSV